MSEAATILKAVRRLRNADTELRRAIAAGDPERTNNAGTSYAIAKFRLFAAAADLREPILDVSKRFFRVTESSPDYYNQSGGVTHFINWYEADGRVVGGTTAKGTAQLQEVKGDCLDRGYVPERPVRAADRGGT